MKKLSFQIAFGGIAAALCLVLMFSVAVIPFMVYAFPMLSGLIIYAVSYECGKKMGLAAYASVAVLLMILSPEKESAMLFAFFFGYYPIFSVFIDRLKSKILQWILRLLVFNCSMVAVYFILMKVLVAVDSEEFTKYSMIFFLLCGNVILVLYDKMIRVMTVKYVKRYRKKLFRRK